MHIVDFYQPQRRYIVMNDYRRSRIASKYFIKNGRNMRNYPWIKLYIAIKEFPLIFKFKYNYRSKTLGANFVPYKFRWLNQMRFMMFYLKLIRGFKWSVFEPKKLTFLLKKAKKACYLGLVKDSIR